MRSVQKINIPHVNARIYFAKIDSDALAFAQRFCGVIIKTDSGNYIVI